MLSQTHVTTFGAEKMISNFLGFGSVVNVVFINDPAPLDGVGSGDKMKAFFKLDENKYTIWNLGNSKASNPHDWSDNYELAATKSNLAQLNPMFAHTDSHHILVLIPSSK
jgi:hypothetical protein